MEPLDPGQEREMAFVRGQPTAWVNLTRARRWLMAAALASAAGLVIAGLAALAGGPWLAFGFGSAALALLILLPNVLIPERMLQRGVRAMTPTAEAMKRGDKNKSWPG